MLLPLLELKTLYLEKLIDKMKCFKNLIISSDGSINFTNNLVKKSNFFTFRLNDDKNCNFYQKTKKSDINSKHLLSYKKKYLK